VITFSKTFTIGTLSAIESVVCCYCEAIYTCLQTLKQFMKHLLCSNCLVDIEMLFNVTWFMFSVVDTRCKFNGQYGNDNTEFDM